MNKDVFFNRLLCTKFLSNDNALSKSIQEAIFIFSSLGMECNAYHACPNDYLLFRHEFENDVVCSKYIEHHYKSDIVCKTIPRKLLQKFPIIP